MTKIAKSKCMSIVHMREREEKSSVALTIHAEFAEANLRQREQVERRSHPRQLEVEGAAAFSPSFSFSDSSHSFTSRSIISQTCRPKTSLGSSSSAPSSAIPFFSSAVLREGSGAEVGVGNFTLTTLQLAYNAPGTRHLIMSSSINSPFACETSDDRNLAAVGTNNVCRIVWSAE